MNHTIIHFEIPAYDVDGLKQFYGKLFDWNVIDMPEMSYVLFHTVPVDEKGMLLEPGVNGGMYQRTAKEQIPINYIAVEDVDEYLEKAVSNGGKVRLGKQEVPGVGFIAVIEDPEGNPIGLIQPVM